MFNQHKDSELGHPLPSLILPLLSLSYFSLPFFSQTGGGEGSTVYGVVMHFVYEQFSFP